MKSFFSVSLTLLLGALVLTSCGFRPMYGARAGEEFGAGHATSIADALATIAIDPIPDQSGVILRNALIDRFQKNGTPNNPVYRLSIKKIEESRSDLDITVDDEATRRQLRDTASFTLTRIDTGKTVLTRSVYAIVSYNVLQSQFTTRVTEQNARENALADLARQIEQAIVLHIRDEPSAQ